MLKVLSIISDIWIICGAVPIHYFSLDYESYFPAYLHVLYF